MHTAPVPLTAHEVQTAVELHRKGHSRNAISLRLGRSAEAVGRAIERGVPGECGRPRKLEFERIVADAVPTGASLDEMSRATGVPRSSVYRIIVRLGLHRTWQEAKLCRLLRDT